MNFSGCFFCGADFRFPNRKRSLFRILEKGSFLNFFLLILGRFRRFLREGHHDLSDFRPGSVGAGVQVADVVTMQDPASDTPVHGVNGPAVHGMTVFEVSDRFRACFIEVDSFDRAVVAEHTQEIFASDRNIGAVCGFGKTRDDMLLRSPFDMGRVILRIGNIAEFGLAGRFLLNAFHASEYGDEHPAGNGELRGESAFRGAVE